MPVKCGFSDRARDILPTIGNGEITLENQGGLEFLNRNVKAHVGNTSGENANLDAHVPVSDMVEFVQSKLNAKPEHAGVSIGGDELIRSIEENEESAQDKLNNAKANFIAKLDETFGRLPDNLSNKDLDRLDKVRETIEEKYDDIALKESEKEKFYLDQDLRPGTDPKVTLEAALGMTKRLLVEVDTLQEEIAPIISTADKPLPIYNASPVGGNNPLTEIFGIPEAQGAAMTKPPYIA